MSIREIFSQPIQNKIQVDLDHKPLDSDTPVYYVEEKIKGVLKQNTEDFYHF